MRHLEYNQESCKYRLLDGETLLRDFDSYEEVVAFLGLQHNGRSVVVTVVVNTDESPEVVATRMHQAAAAEHRAIVTIGASISPPGAAIKLWAQREHG